MIAETILEARREAPVRSQDEDAEESTYSSDRGLEAAPAAGSEEERRKRRRPRRRRAKPEAIAARLKTGEAGEAGAEGGEGDADAGDVDADAGDAGEESAE
jgi:small subunit ribosomal protein S2